MTDLLLYVHQIMLSPGTIDQESVLVQLEWVRAGVPPHPVDTLGGTEIDSESGELPGYWFLLCVRITVGLGLG